MATLSQFQCVPCTGKEPPLTNAEIAGFQPEVPGWTINDVSGEKQLTHVFKFHNFAEALSFTDRVGALAESEGHHPAILTEWGKVTVTWWTHKIHGLHKNDFIMAAKTDQLYRVFQPEHASAEK